VDITFWIELILFILLMGLSGFFSSSETAMFSLKRMELEQMRRDGHPRIDLIEHMLSRPRRLIMTILIGNELVNVSASAISAAVVIQLLGAESMWVNLAIMVPILLLVGEIVPKTLAVRNNIAFAGFESRPIEFFAALVKPVRWLIRKVADRFITLIVGAKRSRGNIITEDMVRTLAYDGVDEGVLESQEAQFIDHILAFNDKKLEDLKTPRSHIFYLPVEMPPTAMMVEMRQARHTKAPVYHKNRDTIVGVLNTRGLLGVDINRLSQEEGGLEKLLLEPYFVPETKLASELFHTFRERKLSLALTVDEYGGVTGLVTMEDLLECIFGDIHSPSDMSRHAYIKQMTDGSFTINAAMLISDLNKEIGSDFTEEWGETIGGLLLHEYGELPPENTIIVLGEFRFTMKQVESNRISTVLLERIKKNGECKIPEAEASASDASAESGEASYETVGHPGKHNFDNGGKE
jgi:CBS domain containing-hemolysin-like protein